MNRGINIIFLNSLSFIKLKTNLHDKIAKNNNGININQYFSESKVKIQFIVNNGIRKKFQIAKSQSKVHLISFLLVNFSFTYII